jgi:hypothetical protein
MGCAYMAASSEVPAPGRVADVLRQSSRSLKPSAGGHGGSNDQDFP